MFRDLVGRIAWDTALERRGAQESWIIFKDHLLPAQERSFLINTKPSKDGRRPPWMNMEPLTQLKHKEAACGKWEQGQETWEEYEDAV